MLSIVAPLLFGLPVAGWQSGMDSNFALALTKGYMQLLGAGVLFPRWLPHANGGWGSPVFYFYGRLPFLVAAGLGASLHLAPVSALLLGFVVFRGAAFLFCRTWLRQHTSERAADCGALVFIALPFAAIANPITRTGFAETAATTFLPLLFLVLDRFLVRDRTPSLAVAGLALIYAALAWTHPLDCLLIFGIVLAYAASFSRKTGGRASGGASGLAGVSVNALGFGLGLCLAAPSVLPAIALRGSITPLGWTETPWVLLSNNFLFTLSRFRLYGLYDLDVALYSTWFLCALVLLLAWRSARVGSAAERRRATSLRITLAACLCAMTVVAEPLWRSVPPLVIVQFPWRLFPGALALTAALVALWVGEKKGRERSVMLSLLPLILLQLAVPATGALFSLSRLHEHGRIPVSLTHCVPVYVPFAERDLRRNNLRNSAVPEYIPAAAHRAGWKPSPDRSSLYVGIADLDARTAPPPSLHEGMQEDGSLAIEGSLPAPQTLLLPLFYFPDERIAGSPGNAVEPDAPTGLARIRLPAGKIAIRVDHGRPLRVLLVARVLAIVGGVILLALLAMASARGELFPRQAKRIQNA